MRKNNNFLLTGILALVLSFTLFGNGIRGDFVFDDTIVIVGNPFINGQLDGFWKIFTNPYFAYQPRPGLYRPLTIASYSINVYVFGQSSAWFHVVNILLHALASFLIFTLVYRLNGKIAAWTAFIFFMFLPIHVEAVTSIVGRAEILSLLFITGALISSLHKRYILASGLFFLGLLSKEMAITFLPIFLFLELFWPVKPSGPRVFTEHKKNFKPVLRGLLYFVPPLVLYATLRYVALGEYFLKNDATFIYNPIKSAPFLSGLWTSFKVFYLYLEKTFFPISLSSDYSFNQISLVANPFVSVKAIGGIIIFTVLIVLAVKTKDFLFKLGVIIFLASYFVVSNWVFKIGTIMAERLMYVPSFGLALIAGSIFSRAILKIKNIKVFYGFILLILLFYAFLILNRNQNWLNENNLYESAYASSPDSVVNKTNKAYLEFKKGKYLDAEKGLNDILNIAPEHVPALNLAGQNYKKLGQYQKAEELWKKAIGLRDDYLRAYLSLGVLYYENGYFKSAEKILTDAVNIYPRWSEVLFLALSKISLDKPVEAAEIIHKYFKDNPSRKELKFALGLAHFNIGEKEIAFRYFNQVKDPKVSMDDFIQTFKGSKIILLGEY